MKGWIKRWIMLRFFMGCKSDSSVCITSRNCLQRKEETGGGVQGCSNVKAPNVFHRILSGLNYRDEEAEVEMKIGFPTDVKHLTHIGTNPIFSSEIMSLPSVSMNELELAMAAQASDTTHSTG